CPRRSRCGPAGLAEIPVRPRWTASTFPAMGIAEARRAVFARHRHPVSAWSRFATIPLVLAPLWTRSPGVAAGVGLWFAVNPVMTPEPSDRDAFATRAMLGEELWTTDPGQDHALTTVNLAGSLALSVAMIAAWKHRAGPAAVGVAATMTATMISWHRYAAIYDKHSR